MPVLAKKLLFSLIPVSVLLAGATLALWEMESQGVVQTERVGDSVMYLADGYLKLETGPNGSFFQIMDAQHPGLVQARFSQTPAEGTTRIFITGGSFIRGEHHLNPGAPPSGFGALSDWLEAILEARYPGRGFEVINAGASAQNSFRVRSIVEHLVGLGPDLLIVGTGNNEGALPPTRYNEALHRWIVYRGMKRALLDEPAPGEERPWLQAQSASSDALTRAFRRNLRLIVKYAGDADVPLVLLTLPGNMAGLTQLLPPLPESDLALEEGAALCAAGETEAGLTRMTESRAQARAMHLMGDCLRDAGRPEEALELYHASAELEPSGRAKPSYNAYVRDLAAESGLTIVDLEQAMASISPGGLPGARLFIDSCHLKIAGYYEMAAAIAEGLEAQLGAPAAGTPSIEALVERRGWQEEWDAVVVGGGW